MPAPSLFAAELRAGSPSAIERLRLALTQAKTLREAASAVGINPRTLEDWVSEGRPSAIAAAVTAWREVRARRAQAMSNSPCVTTGRPV